MIKALKEFWQAFRAELTAPPVEPGQLRVRRPEAPEEPFTADERRQIVERWVALPPYGNDPAAVASCVLAVGATGLRNVGEADLAFVLWQLSLLRATPRGTLAAMAALAELIDTLGGIHDDAG